MSQDTRERLTGPHKRFWLFWRALRAWMWYPWCLMRGHYWHYVTGRPVAICQRCERILIVFRPESEISLDHGRK